MKIIKISKIDNFGIFKNFDWVLSLANPTTQNINQTYDFKDINIFYGRNYSGKTSLSRIIRALETKIISPKYQYPDFQITLADENTITPNSLANFTHPIHVYNSDFVKENLKFIHDDTQDIESFSVTLGGDNRQILDRIQQLKDELGSNEENSESGIFSFIKNKKIEVTAAQTTFSSKDRELQSYLSNKASGKTDSIRAQHSKFGDSNYNITKLSRDIQLVIQATYKPLEGDVKTNHEKLILQIKKETPPALSIFNANFSNIVKAVEDILSSQVGQSNKIEELVKNGALNKWVETGLDHHINRATCVFCSNVISLERLDSLHQHFDEESKKLKDRIQNGITQINQEKQIINNTSFDISHFYDNFHTELNQIKTKINSLLVKQRESFESLISYLEDKKDKLFSMVYFTHPIDYSNEIQKNLDDINFIRDKHIELTDRLKQDQNEAKNELRLDHIYQFIQDIDYRNLTTEIEISKQAITPHQNEYEKLDAKKREILASIKSEEDRLRSESEACCCINSILEHDFGHQSLRLEAIETNTNLGQIIKFEIQRSGVKAHNLSEGECSLISFCYFLAKIQDDLDQDKKPIIWIDDPISSLDSNHIFFIFSLIEQRICQDKKYGQLFISTHNLDFLKYLRRIKGVESDNSINTVKEQNRKASYFLIQRNDSISTIKEMPIYLSKFLTEFNFLFDQIYKCATVTNIDDTNFTLFYNFGNNARKFLEIYTFYKYPSPKYSLDKQLKVFWGEEIHKTLTDRIHNEYSHMTGILERGGLISDQPEMQKSAIAIIKKVQEDRVQYNALLESIEIDPTTDLLHHAL